MNDSPVDCQSRDRPSHGEKPKSMRLFVAVARPNPLCSTKNEDGIYEKYDADTGEGKGCPCFSRSSAFIMEFILDFL